MVIRISEGPTAADRHEARAGPSGDHGLHSFCVHPPNTQSAHRTAADIVIGEGASNQTLAAG
jgi:hypothetical protein